MWERAPIKDQQGNELDDFNEIWRNFGQGSWQKQVALNSSIDELDENEHRAVVTQNKLQIISHPDQISHITLEELFNLAADPEKGPDIIWALH